MNKENEITIWQKFSNALLRIVRRRYYFITYQGVRRDSDPSISIWHDVTNLTPMQYRQEQVDCEGNTDRKSFYKDFIILNTERISKRQYRKWKGYF